MKRALGARLEPLHDNDRRIAAGALWIALVVLAAKSCAAVREMAIAWRFGVSATVDAYQLALTVTTWLPMWLAGVLGFVLVPRLIALRGGKRDNRFIAELNGVLLLVGAALVALSCFVAPLVTAALAGPLAPRTRDLAASMAGTMAPLALFIVAGGYFAARLQARDDRAFGISEAAPALTIALLVAIAPPGAEAASLTCGTLLGWFLCVAWLASRVAQRDPPFGAVALRWRSRQWSTLSGPILAMGAGQLLLTLAIPIDQAFAATLGEGAVAALGYVNRIMTLITSLGFVVLARALLPILSEEATQGDTLQARDRALRWAGLMACLGAAICSVGWFLSPWAVASLFERGAFRSADTALVSQVLRYSLAQLPFFFAGSVLAQWYAAAGRYRSLFAICLAATLSKVVSNLLLAEAFGLVGIAVSTAIMYALMALMLAMATECSGKNILPADTSGIADQG